MISSSFRAAARRAVMKIVRSLLGDCVTGIRSDQCEDEQCEGRGVVEPLELRQLLAFSDSDSLVSFYQTSTVDRFLNVPAVPVTTSSGVSPATGAFVTSVADLGSGGFGTMWGHTRSWSNTAGLGPNGNHWVVREMPFLVQANSGTTVVAVDGGESQRWFDQAGGGWAARLGGMETLSEDGTAKEFVLADPSGARVTYYSFDSQVPAAQRGRIKRYQDAYGNTTSINYDSEGRIGDASRSQTIGGFTTKESFFYAYRGTGDGVLESVMLRRKKWSSSVSEPLWDDTAFTDAVRKVTYSYYSNGDAFGGTNDLKTAIVTARIGGAWVSLNTSYYRYYVAGSSAGNVGYLKYVVEGDSHERLKAGLTSPTTPLTASDATVAGYADHYFEYDTAKNRVMKHTAQGLGSSSSNGLGTELFAYTANTSTDPSSNAMDANAWRLKVVQSLPDSTPSNASDDDKVTWYFNEVGQPMLVEAQDHAYSGGVWRTFNRYDASGRVVLTASPSAVNATATLGASDDLLNLQSGNFTYLNDSAGFVQAFEYYTTDTATSSTAGGVAGLLKSTKIRQGELGTDVPQSLIAYFKVGAGSSPTRYSYPVAETTRYRNDNGSGAQTTTFTYTFFSGTLQPETIVTSLPSVSAGQNGPGVSAAGTTVLDRFGRVRWTKDADGYLAYADYDIGTGAVVKQIQDVSSSLTADFVDLPTGWATPSGGGLHLITSTEIDSLGRATKLTTSEGNASYQTYNDAAFETRSYPVFISGTPAGPTVVTRSDRARGYTEVLSMSATPTLVGGVPNGSEAVANVQSLTRTYTNVSGQVIAGDRYFSLSGLTYSQSVDIGSVGVHRYRTEYQYDSRGLQNRVRSATGTIARTVYDALGRPIETWTGVDDADWATASTPSLMTRVTRVEYDHGSVGDGRVTSTASSLKEDSGALEISEYDWRGRLVLSKSSDETGTEDASVNRSLVFRVYDNLDQLTAVWQYDGDGLTPTIQNGVAVQPTSQLVAKSTTDYDDLGRAYATHVFSVDPSTGTVSSTSLTAGTWFDKRGNVIKTVQPGGLTTKFVVDGAGRVMKQFSTDGGGDSTWADAGDVSGDRVLSQQEVSFDKDGRVIFAISRERFHDDGTSTGALGNPQTAPYARVSYAESFYDAAGRLTAAVDLGTNGGTALTSRPDSAVPTRSDTKLVTSYDHGVQGGVQTDPRGIATKVSYDALGRKTEVIEAYDPNVNGGAPSGVNNRTTRFVYDAGDHVVAQSAVLPGGGEETTRYVYGVGKDGTLDTTFNGSGKLVTSVGGTERGQVVRIQPDGKIVVAGYTYSGSTPNYDFVIVRYNADGTTDTTFGVNGVRVVDFGNTDDRATSMLLQADGKILVGGRTYTSVADDWNFALVRLNADGSLDTSFSGDAKITKDLGGSDVVYSLAISNNKVVAGGFSNRGGDFDFALIRYNLSDGSLDTTFNSPTNYVVTDFGGGSSDAAYALAVQADGRIVAAGTSGGDVALARYNTNGTLDTAFGTSGLKKTSVGGTEAARTVLINGTDIVIAGDTDNAATQELLVVRYQSDGTLRTSFGTSGVVKTDVANTNDFGYGLVLQPDGKMVVGGYAGVDFVVVRYTNLGALDETFGTAGSGKVTTHFSGSSADAAYFLSQQPDGKLIAVGSTNGNGDIALARYHDAGGNFGVLGGTGNSKGHLINSNDILSTVSYPDKSTGAPSGQQSDQEQFVYGAGGQRLYSMDRNGTIHKYDYDVEARIAADSIVKLGAGVNNSVLRLGYAYDRAGRPLATTSYQDAAGTTVANQIQYAYNGLGQLTAEYQSHSGTVNTSTTPKVQYVYSEMASGANHSRLTSMVYPNGRVLHYVFNTGLDASISRVSYLADDNGGSPGQSVEEYAYLGLGAVVQSTRPDARTRLTYVKLAGESNGDGGDQYTGLDRFGRVVDQRWIATLTSADLDRFRYGYDRNGNVLYKENVVSTSNSELYHANGAAAGYDLLNRLTNFARGTLSDTNSDGIVDTIGSTSRSQSWSLDQMGNWTSQTTNGSAVSRTHNLQNQVTAVGASTLTYDDNGNVTKDERGYTYAYDGWNRLVTVKNASNVTVATYAYDAASRRISTQEASSRELYYSSSWQVLEERTTAGATAAQQVWGLAYVDALVLRDADADGSSGTGSLGKSASGLEQRLYAQQDANHNVTSLTTYNGTAAVVQERYQYDPYGAATFLDGVWGARGSSSYGWLYLFQGGRYSASTGLTNFRNRDLSATLGRWLTADPMGYVDGMNLYEFVASMPASATDPSGYAFEMTPNGAGEGTMTLRWYEDENGKHEFDAQFRVETIEAILQRKIKRGDVVNIENAIFPASIRGYAIDLDLGEGRILEFNVTGTHFAGNGINIIPSNAKGAKTTYYSKFNISDNTAENNYGPGLFHWLAFDGAKYGKPLIDAVVHGNTITNRRGDTRVEDVISFSFVRGKPRMEIAVTANTITGAFGVGRGFDYTGGGIMVDKGSSYVWVGMHRNGVVDGNTVSNVDNHGISVAHGTYNVVVGNTVIGNGKFFEVAYQLGVGYPLLPAGMVATTVMPISPFNDRRLNRFDNLAQDIPRRASRFLYNHRDQYSGFKYTPGLRYPGPRR